MSALSKAVLATICVIGGPLQAHEFWIEAEDYTVDSGAPVIATFRNGQMLVGSALSYIPSRSTRYDMIVAGEMRDVPARIGDNPAFDVADLPDGLLTIVHETGDMTVNYTEWAKWVKFTEHKAATQTQQAHVDRGFSQDEVNERYRRFAKALVAVGDGAGEDARRGLLVEFVAEANPYTDDLGDGLPVRIFDGDAPKAGAQIEMFDMAPDGTVAVTLHTADDEGRAVVPVTAGHEYLLDSVSFRPLDPDANDGHHWQTDWAALTFAVPEE